jgi:hypothetical protein
VFTVAVFDTRMLWTGAPPSNIPALLEKWGRLPSSGLGVPGGTLTDVLANYGVPLQGFWNGTQRVYTLTIPRK